MAMNNFLFTPKDIHRMVFGDAWVAQLVLSKGDLGDFFSINWGFGIAVILSF